MKCDICNKNMATVHLTEIIDDKVTELHLCEHCAKEKGSQMESHFGLSDLLAGLSDFGVHPQTDKEAAIKCSMCGLTYEDFRKIGRLGCAKCYETFRSILAPLLKRIHGSNQHIGKAPIGIEPVKAEIKAGPKKTNELQELKKRLQAAVVAENFEEAARVRDQIRELEKQNKPKTK